jgi:hypothetical protein
MVMLGFLSWLRRSSDYELEVPQFLRRFNLYLLPVSTDDIVPGAVVAKGGHRGKGFTYQGHLSELMPRIPDSFWDTELNKANLVTNTVSHSVNLKNKNSLSLWGIQVGGGLDEADSAKLQIKDIHARTFRGGKGHASILSLQPILARLSVIQPESFSILLNKYVVMETYYASEVVLEFDAGAGADLQADVEKAGGIQVNGNAEARWKNNSMVTVSQNVEVPFAFSGFRIGK